MTSVEASPEPSGKTPRTDRGRKTLRKLLNAAAIEFGEHGFHDASITGITRRAGTALGSFYTYFDSKDEIFKALVEDLSSQVRDVALKARQVKGPALEVERAALTGFLQFARAHKDFFRIIDQCEFVDPENFRRHYESTAARILGRLERGVEKGELREGLGETHAWAIMGMSAFLGLRFGVWSDDAAAEEIAEVANSILREGIGARAG